MRSKKFFLLLSLFALLVSALPLMPAQAQEEPGTIVDIAVATPELSTLVAAVEAAGLVETLSGEGPFTVFAPTNEAFEALPEGMLDEVLANPAVLNAILTYHVVPGRFTTANMGRIVRTPSVYGEVVRPRLKVNGDIFIDLPDASQAKVITADIEASNGVIHLIDAVLVPAVLPKTIAELAAENENLTTVVTALGIADPSVSATLAAPTASITLFAPVNDAFTATFSQLGIAITDVAGNPELVTSILLYHALEGVVLAEDVIALDGQEVETLNGESIAVSVVEGGVVLNGTVNVTATDITASNGVVHLIDGVLVPPSALEALGVSQ